ncbi:LLM class flavin-dependent oxidoreductase [Nocardioides houyundeii]|uniref:LLM class flavin-dependent oxidoreductase n=1 Tax=Nocardioides houyundeii TaxID=2045452 RepID=UPI001F53D3D9|nr:LLM class flavin-dependent oxidoreductase [Nocardioides houyundeii]
MTSPALPAMPTLSVLDLVPVRTDQTTGDAINASLSLARTADGLGYRRYWLAEHHNMPAVAATNPPLLIAMVAGATSRIRVGSGGVMLPNHAPLVIAEQFALLEAAYPDRIDLGIGRAPGTDQLTRYALRQGAGGEDPVAEFPRYVDDIGVLMSEHGAAMAFNGREHPLKATPKAASVAPIWLLGSSDYSARLAASRGLPYVFAHHFAGQGTAEALELYRTSYQPSERFPEPRTFLTVNACVADSAEEAERLALPQVLQMLAIMTGAPLTPQRLVEEAEKVEVPRGQQGMVDGMLRRWVVGDAESSRTRIAQLAAEFGVDEVMIHPVAGSFTGTPAAATPAREETLRLLAA